MNFENFVESHLEVVLDKLVRLKFISGLRFCLHTPESCSDAFSLNKKFYQSFFIQFEQYKPFNAKTYIIYDVYLYT
jgi:hypothetical protein